MPSPDVAAYVGLTLAEGLDAQTLLTNALTNAALSFPDWTPREGNTEVVLLEEIAAMVEDNGYTINQLPAAITEVLLRLFGLTRDPGAPVTATVRFTLADTLGHTIPTGTVVRIGGEAAPVDLTTTTDLVVAVGASTGTVTVTGAQASAAGNGTATGTVAELLDAIPYVDAVTLTTDATGGRPPEDGAGFLNRGAPLLSRLTDTLVRPVDFEAYVAETWPTVTRVKVLDLYSTVTPETAPGTVPGYVGVVVAGPAGSSLGAPTRATIATALAARAHAGLKIGVRDADVTTVDVNLTVLAFPGANVAATRAAVIARVTAYLNPDTWPWATLSRVNELIATADQAAGVDTVLTVTQKITGTVPAAVGADLTLPGYAPLAKTGIITVTVTEAV